MFVYDCPDTTGAHHTGHVANPVLQISPLAWLVTEPEGCLSAPGRQVALARSALATSPALTSTGSR